MVIRSPASNPGPGCGFGVLLDNVHGRLLGDAGGFDEFRVAFADMNADGIDDIVVLTKQGIFSGSVFKALHRAAATRPGLLTRIKNGRGAVTEIGYRSLQSLDIEAATRTGRGIITRPSRRLWLPLSEPSTFPGQRTAAICPPLMQ